MPKMRSCRLLAFSTLLAACEEDLAGRDPLPTPYSVYGVISPDFEIQSIRVYPLEVTPTLGTSASLDADVTSTDLTTGSRQTWRDTVLVDENGGRTRTRSLHDMRRAWMHGSICRRIVAP